MTGIWTKFEGQTVNGLYPLQRCLSTSDHSAVFLTESTARQLPRAAIKLTPAHPSLSEMQLAYWKIVAGLTDSHLMRQLDFGRCQLNAVQFLFVVMDYTDETLAQILPQRALTPEEVRQMLAPILDGLSSLHAQNLVQGQLKPTNILVVNDNIVLASDTIRPAGELRASLARSSLYDPPEARHGRMNSAGDLWALGITLIEALTQRPPLWADDRAASSSLPTAIPADLAEIVGRCLSANPADRPTAAALADQLKGVTPPEVSTEQSPAAPEPSALPAESSAPPAEPAAPAAESPVSAGGPSAPVAGPSSLAAGLSPSPSEPPSVATGLPPAASESPAASSESSSRSAAVSPLPPSSSSGSTVARAAASRTVSTVAPVRPASSANLPPPDSSPPLQEARRGLPIAAIAIAVVLLVVIWGATHLFRGRSQPASSPAAQSAISQSGISDASGSSGSSGSGTGSDSSSVAPSPSAAASGSPAAPASTGSNDASASTGHPAQASTSSGAVPGAVTHEEMPVISRSAQGSIRGHIKISVRVNVDDAGNVKDALLVVPGSSRYFARQAMDAAMKWKFAPSEDRNAHKRMLQFEFSRAGNTAHAVPLR